MVQITRGEIYDSWRPITVHVTRDVANDRSKMQKVTIGVLEILGCPECHSGHVLRFEQIRDLVVNPKTLDVREAQPGGF